MKYGEIRFLTPKEEAVLPRWARLLPSAWRARYCEAYRPYRLEQADGRLCGILQTTRENAHTAAWRQAANALLQKMRQEGVGIAVPPAEGDLPQDILPLANGRRLTALFAFAGAGEALRRQGKEAAACSYLIAGGEPSLWRRIVYSMGNEVNRLAIFTDNAQMAEPLAARLYAACGLQVEVFSSPKNPALRRADAILSCGMEQRAYEHILKPGCFWLDLAGNRPALRRIRRTRTDIAAADGFFFRLDAKQLEGRFAEAEAYLRCAAFRQGWEEGMDAEQALAALMQEGFCVSGFSALGKRIKIAKAQE